MYINIGKTYAGISPYSPMYRYIIYMCLVNVKLKNPYFTDRRIEPMQKVINYMKERQLRPTELFRSFDKNVANKLNNQQLIERIKVSGSYLCQKMRTCFSVCFVICRIDNPFMPNIIYTIRLITL